MNKQMIFYVILSVLILLKGIFSGDLIIQLIAIMLISLAIYEEVFNGEERKKYEDSYTKGPNLLGFIGKADLILRLLLALSIFIAIPVVLIIIPTIIILIKAFIFVWGGDIASMVDIFFSIIIISTIAVAIPSIMLFAMAIWFTQKGIVCIFL